MTLVPTHTTPVPSPNFQTRRSDHLASVRLSKCRNYWVQSLKNVFNTFFNVCVCVGGCRWGFGCPCPPVRNIFVTPHHLFMFQRSILTHFMDESSRYETWVTVTIRQTEKNLPPFYLELWEWWTKKLALDLFRDGFPICRGPFVSGMWKNWRVAALKCL